MFGGRVIKVKEFPKEGNTTSKKVRTIFLIIVSLQGGSVRC